MFNIQVVTIEKLGEHVAGYYADDVDEYDNVNENMGKDGDEVDD